MIPVNEPRLDGNERRYLLECLDTGWISSGGPYVTRFEEQFGSFLGLPRGVAVCNGTAALEAALYGLGVGEGDEVIMPSFTIISCAAAAIRLGARPVFVDIDPETWCMDASQIESAISSRTKVIMPVHMYGHPVDMDPVVRVARKHNLQILEDAAEVHGAEYYSTDRGVWLKCGSIGDAASFSFYANKIVTTGEGGMVVSPIKEVVERARSYQNLCFRPERRFYHTELGYNFRMTNMQAAIGVAQLERVQSFIDHKRSMADLYRSKLSQIHGVRFMSQKPWARSVFWMYSVELDEELGLTAEEVISRLRKSGVEARPFFMGLHAQPALEGHVRLLDGGYPHTEKSYRLGLYLPSGMTLTPEVVKTVCDRLRESLY